MATKTKAKKKRPPLKPKSLGAGLQTIDASVIGEALAYSTQSLNRIEHLLAQIADTLTRAMIPPAPGPASSLPGGDEEYISGQWHRRAGDVYGRVAAPNTPNAAGYEQDVLGGDPQILDPGTHIDE